MKIYTISLMSVTHAFNARSLLASKGFECEIVRTPTRLGGCGYSVRTRGDISRILAVLSEKGIPVKAYAEGQVRL